MSIRLYQNRKTNIVQALSYPVDGWIPLAEPGEQVIALETDSHIQEGKSYTVKNRQFEGGVALYIFGNWNRYAYRFRLANEELEVSCL